LKQWSKKRRKQQKNTEPLLVAKNITNMTNGCHSISEGCPNSALQVCPPEIDHYNVATVPTPQNKGSRLFRRPIIYLVGGFNPSESQMLIQLKQNHLVYTLQLENLRAETVDVGVFHGWLGR